MSFQAYLDNIEGKAGLRPRPFIELTPGADRPGQKCPVVRAIISRWPLPELLVGAAGTHFDPDGNVTDPELRASLVELVEALREWTLRIDSRRAAA